MDKKGLLGMLLYFSTVAVAILMAWVIANCAGN